MNYHQLQVFLAVADAGSFVRGAEVMHLSQPTVSQHIAALEGQLGLNLLDRSRKGVRLTEAGKVLRRHARLVAGAMEAAERAASGFRNLEDVPLRVGVSTIPGTYLVPLVMPMLVAEHPGLRLVLVQGDSRQTLDRLATEAVEVGMVGSRFEQRGLHYASVGKDAIRLVVAPGHPWSVGGAIHVDQLTEAPLVLRESGSGTGKTVGEALHRAGVDTSALQVRAEVGSTEAMKAVVSSGIAAAFLSEWAFRREAEQGLLMAVDVDGLTIERPFYLVRRTGRSLSPAATVFWEAVVAHFR